MFLKIKIKIIMENDKEIEFNSTLHVYITNKP